MQELIKYLKEYKAYVEEYNSSSGLSYEGDDGNIYCLEGAKTITLDGFLEWLANKEV